MKIKSKFGGTKYKLRTMDFPARIDHRNLCFLKKRSLYLLVWDGGRVDDLEGWLNCLISYANDSVIMVVNPYKTKNKNCKEDLKNYLNQFPAANLLNFGLWNCPRDETDHWFTQLDVFNEKGIMKLENIIFF